MTVDRALASAWFAQALTPSGWQLPSPWDALAAWLRRFIDYIATKRALMDALSTGSPVFGICRSEMYAAGTPLFERAQAAGDVRADLTFDDLVRMLSGLTSATFTDEEQRERVFRIALDGIRARS